MTLRLVANSEGPVRRRSRRRRGEQAIELRTIECRPDLYVLLRDSWAPGRQWRRLVLSLLLMFAILAALLWLAGPTVLK